MKIKNEGKRLFNFKINNTRKEDKKKAYAY